MSSFFVPFLYKVQFWKIRQPVLFHKPPVLALSIQSLVDTLSQLRGIESPVQKIVDVGGLIGLCQEVVDLPHGVSEGKTAANGCKNRRYNTLIFS